MLALIAGAGQAADFGMRRALPAAPELPSFYSWTGFYLGAQIGYSWDGDRTRPFAPLTGLVTGSHKLDTQSLVGGGHAGLNYQSGAFVVGVEGDLEAGEGHGGGRFGGFDDIGAGGRVQRDWQASVRARLGYAFDRFMIYGTGGAAFTQFDYKIAGFAAPVDLGAQVSRTGWTAGGGVAYAFTDHIIGGLDYRYTDFGRFAHFATSAPVAFDQKPTLQALRASVSYKF